MSDPTPNDLKEAAKAVIVAIKEVAKGIKDPRIRLAIIGGTALALRLAAAHKPTRSTKDVDFWIEGITPSELREKIVKAESPNTRFTKNMENESGMTYKSPFTKKVIKIDLVTAKITPYTPKLYPLETVADDDQPIVTRDDLILLKAVSCSEREIQAKGIQDAQDVQTLVRDIPGPLIFTDTKDPNEARKIVSQHLIDLATRTDWDLETWRKNLKLPKDEL